MQHLHAPALQKILKSRMTSWIRIFLLPVSRYFCVIAQYKLYICTNIGEKWLRITLEGIVEFSKDEYEYRYAKII